MGAFLRRTQPRAPQRTCRSLAEGAYASSLQKTNALSLSKPLYIRLRTTLAHLPPANCSTAYCSRTAAFFFPATALMSRPGSCALLLAKELTTASNVTASRLRTTETGSCLCGARRTRTLDLRDECVKQIRALARKIFSLSCGQLPEREKSDSLIRRLDVNSGSAGTNISSNHALW